MKVKTFKLIEECIERGVRVALLNENDLNRDNLNNLEWLIERYTSRVMNELDEYFTFDDN